jgi:hypothetical protein
MLQSLSAKAGTTVRRFGAAAGVLALGLVSASPAFAWWDRWHHWHGDRCWNCGPAVVVGAPPPVVYAPPVYYAPPPPVVYAPGISFGVHIR